MKLTKCKKCGSKINSGTTICPYCGKKQTKVGYGVIVAIFIIIFIAMSNQKNNNDSKIVEYKTSVNTQQAQSDIKALSADSLMTRAIVQYEASIRQGEHAREYLNEFEYLNKTVTLRDTIYAILPASGGEPTRVIFSAGPCLSERGNIIECIMNNSEEIIKESGQKITISGILTHYGRPDMAAKESSFSCGYLIVLRDCKVIQ